MSERTFGETKDCRGCRWRSEMLAQAGGSAGRGLQAMCLNPASPMSLKYTYGWQSCDVWASGELGAVDERGQDPARYDEDEVEL